MFKKIKNFLILSFVCLTQTGQTFAQGILSDDTKNKINNNTTEIDAFSQGQTIWSIVAMVINAFLSLMAIIFLVLMIIAGYNWMTAGGNEKKVETAKETIKRAVIGFALIMSAYIITSFVMKNLPGNTN